MHVRKPIRKDPQELVNAGYPVRFSETGTYKREFCPAELTSLWTAAAHFRIERIMDIHLTDMPIKSLEMIESREKGIDV